MVKNVAITLANSFYDTIKVNSSSFGNRYNCSKENSWLQNHSISNLKHRDEGYYENSKNSQEFGLFSKGICAITQKEGKQQNAGFPTTLFDTVGAILL